MPRDRVRHLWVLHAKSVPRNGLWERRDLEFDADEPRSLLPNRAIDSFNRTRPPRGAIDKKRASSFQLSQDGERPSIRNVSPPKVIRAHRPRIADDFFKQEWVRFERARIDMSGSILVGGHKLNLSGTVLVRRDKVCMTAEGPR